MMQYILLVDDDQDDTDLFEEALKEIDVSLHITILHSATASISYLEDGQQQKPDIIFIDVNIILMSGWDCLKKIKQDPVINRIPVVMYSTSSYRGDAQKALSLGALCFFTKPSNYSSLKQILRFILEHPTENLQVFIVTF